MRAKEQVSHYVGEKPVESLKQQVASRSQETDQYKTAKIVRTSPPVQEFMPLGYNRENILDRVARADFWGFNVGIDPNFAAEYNKNGKVNFEQFVRSTTDSYGINSNQFIWDAIPELENFPVSGKPQEVQQQYVLYNVEPAFLASTKKNLHISQQSVPVAYNAQIPTQKSQEVVYQTPVTNLVNAATGASFLQRLKTFLVGS